MQAAGETYFDEPEAPPALFPEPLPELPPDIEPPDVELPEVDPELPDEDPDDEPEEPPVDEEPLEDSSTCNAAMVWLSSWPLGLKPLERWNSIRACRVFGPSLPSAGPASCPAALSFSCACFTTSGLCDCALLLPEDAEPCCCEEPDEELDGDGELWPCAKADAVASAVPATMACNSFMCVSFRDGCDGGASVNAGGRPVPQGLFQPAEGAAGIRPALRLPRAAPR